MKKTYPCRGCGLTTEVEVSPLPEVIRLDEDPPAGWEFIEYTDGYWAWMCPDCLKVRKL